MFGCRLHLHCSARVKQCLNHGVGQWFICIGTLAKWKFSINHPEQPPSLSLSLSLYKPNLSFSFSPVKGQRWVGKSNENPQWHLHAQRHGVQGQRWMDCWRLHRVHLPGKCYRTCWNAANPNPLNKSAEENFDPFPVCPLRWSDNSVYVSTSLHYHTASVSNPSTLLPNYKQSSMWPSAPPETSSEGFLCAV